MPSVALCLERTFFTDLTCAPRSDLSRRVISLRNPPGAVAPPPPRRRDVSCRSDEARDTWPAPVGPCFPHTEGTSSSRVESVGGLLQPRKLGFSLADCRMSRCHRGGGTRLPGCLEVTRGVCGFRSFSEERPCSRPRAEAVLPSQSCVELARAGRVACHWTGTSRGHTSLYSARSLFPCSRCPEPCGLRTGAPRWVHTLAPRLFPREADSGAQALGKAEEASQRLARMGGVPTLAGLSGVSVLPGGFSLGLLPPGAQVTRVQTTRQDSGRRRN